MYDSGGIEDPIRACTFSRTQDPVECGYRRFFGTTARFGLTPLVQSYPPHPQWSDRDGIRTPAAIGYRYNVG